MIALFFFEGQTLFYSAPVDLDDDLPYVLVGIRSKKNMQRIIASSAFSGNTLSCIIDNQGGVILSPTDFNPFTQIDNLFKSDPQGGTSEEIRRMQKDMISG